MFLLVRLILLQVPWEYGPTEADFQVGQYNAVLYLSESYHRQHRDYIYKRVAALGRKFRVRVLLVHVEDRSVLYCATGNAEAALLPGVEALTLPSLWKLFLSCA